MSVRPVPRVLIVESDRNVVELMVHEPFLAFREGSWRQDLVALVHRLMITVLSLEFTAAG